jgi:hypothetical protein
MKSVQPELAELRLGTWDGQGAGDHNQAYRFGFRPRAENPFSFNTRQYARLLILRSGAREKDTEWTT